MAGTVNASALTSSVAEAASAGAGDQITQCGLSMWPGLPPQDGGLRGVGFLTCQPRLPNASVPVDEAEAAMRFLTRAQKPCNITSSTHCLGEGATGLPTVKMGTETPNS